MTHDLTMVSEERASELTNTSAKTLEQFSAAGLLGPVMRDGKKMYSVKDLEVLFHIERDELNAPPNEVSAIKTQGSGSEIAEASTSSVALEDREDPESTAAQKSSTEQTKPSGPNATPADEASSAKKEAISSEPSVQGETYATTDSTPLAHRVERISVDASNIDIVRKNQSLIEQIEALKEERDWLRKRLENTETRIERDQMLLISKSETIRQLVLEKNKRSSFWNFALPLFRPFEDLRKSITGLAPALENATISEDKEQKPQQISEKPSA